MLVAIGLDDPFFLAFSPRVSIVIWALRAGGRQGSVMIRAARTPASSTPSPSPTRPTPSKPASAPSPKNSTLLRKQRKPSIPA